MRRHPRLPVDDDAEFQRRDWIFERIGRAAMGLLVVAALAGAFASGPLSEAEARDPNGALRIDYDRFMRKSAQSTLHIVLSHGADSAGSASIVMSEGLVDAVRIKTVTPRPVEVDSTPEGLVFRFKLTPGKPVGLRFFLEPRTVGRVTASVGLPGQKPAALAIFVYP